MRFGPTPEKLALVRAMDRLRERMDELAEDVRSRVGAFQPTHQVAAVERTYREWQKAWEGTVGDAPWDLPDSLRPLVVAALLRWRHEKARNLEQAYSKLSDRSVVQDLSEELQVLDVLASQEWFKDTTPMRHPTLNDIVSLELAEREVRRVWEGIPRAYDEKFHILQAPQLVKPDLTYFRNACSMRGRGVGLAFVDIDDFKALNTDFGESAVDVIVLPALMRVLEAAVFGRGFAYRQGGDEYVICVPNIDAGDFEHLLDRTREDVATLEYQGIGRRTTVSIGFVILEAHSPVTEQEALTRSVEAKNLAKKSGKNQVKGLQM